MKKIILISIISILSFGDNLINNLIKDRIDYYKCIDKKVDYKKIGDNLKKIDNNLHKKQYIYKTALDYTFLLSANICRDSFNRYVNDMKIFYDNIDKKNHNIDYIRKIIIMNKADNLFYDRINRYLTENRIFNIAEAE